MQLFLRSLRGTLKKIFRHIANNFFIYGIGIMLIGVHFYPEQKVVAIITISIVMIMAIMIVADNMAKEYKNAIVKLKQKEIQEKLDNEKWLT